MSVYSFEVKPLGKPSYRLDEYKGKVLLIVNTASECGFAPQLEDLEQLYQDYKNEGFIVLGFPCNQFKHQEPLKNEEIAEYCSMKYEVTFPLHEKIDVKGKHMHPLYRYLVEESGNKKIKWNYTKFLIGIDGEVAERYGSMTNPEKMRDKIVQLLEQ